MSSAEITMVYSPSARTDNPLVARRDEALVPLMAATLQSVVFRGEPRCDVPAPVVRRSVVDDEDSDVDVFLVENASHTFGESARTCSRGSRR